MATNILAAMNDVAKLAKLTADANAENAQRELDLTAKKELIAIAAAINAAAAKGVNELDYNLSAAVNRLTNLNLAYALGLIEADMEAANYTFEQHLNARTHAVDGYKITWEYVEEPAGETGNDEPVGETGVTGVTGETGNEEPIGETGVTGETGNEEPNGETGETGETGVTGETGNEEPIGETGETGATGETGITGETGETGVTGEEEPEYRFDAVSEEELIEHAEDSPAELGWYEAGENEGEYIETEDTEINEEKTYYIRSVVEAE
jgi:hypothetical protein